MSAPSQVGVFFDLDGTLLPAPSLEWRFIGHLLARDEITTASALRWLRHWAKTFLRNPHAAPEGNKQYLAGLRESLVRDWEELLTPESTQLFLEGLKRISWHIGEQHRVFLVSGTLAPLARTIARSLPGDIGVVASELEVCAGCWTGRLASEHISGKAKARALRALCAEHGLRPDQSYAYGDGINDLPMLESVGHPAAVNPTTKLRRIARRRGWPVHSWTTLHSAADCDPAQWLAPKEAR